MPNFREYVVARWGEANPPTIRMVANRFRLTGGEVAREIQETDDSGLFYASPPNFTMGSLTVLPLDIADLDSLTVDSLDNWLQANPVLIAGEGHRSALENLRSQIAETGYQRRQLAQQRAELSQYVPMGQLAISEAEVETVAGTSGDEQTGETPTEQVEAVEDPLEAAAAPTLGPAGSDMEADPEAVKQWMQETFGIEDPQVYYSNHPFHLPVEMLDTVTTSRPDLFPLYSDPLIPEKEFVETLIDEGLAWRRVFAMGGGESGKSMPTDPAYTAFRHKGRKFFHRSALAKARVDIPLSYKRAKKVAA